jgi:hypothetical protein
VSDFPTNNVLDRVEPSISRICLDKRSNSAFPTRRHFHKWCLYRLTSGRHADYPPSGRTAFLLPCAKRSYRKAASPPFCYPPAGITHKRTGHISLMRMPSCLGNLALSSTRYPSTSPSILIFWRKQNTSKISRLDTRFEDQTYLQAIAAQMSPPFPPGVVSSYPRGCLIPNQSSSMLHDLHRFATMESPSCAWPPFL